MSQTLDSKKRSLANFRIRENHFCRRLRKQKDPEIVFRIVLGMNAILN